MGADRTAARRWLQPVAIGGAAVLLALLWLAPQLRTAIRRATMPYAEALDCPLPGGPCSVRFPDGEVRLTVAAIEGGRLRFEVRATTAPEALELSGEDMNMGLFRVRFREGEGGHFAIAGLPACDQEKMRWRAEVLFSDRTAAFLVVETSP